MKVALKVTVVVDRADLLLGSAAELAGGAPSEVRRCHGGVIKVGVVGYMGITLGQRRRAGEQEPIPGNQDYAVDQDVPGVADCTHLDDSFAGVVPPLHGSNPSQAHHMSRSQIL